MTPKELADHKAAKKRLEGVPSFHKSKSGTKLALINLFCTTCGIETGPEGGLWN